MITDDDIFDALTKCTGYDPAHTPKPSEIVVDAWVEHFSDYPAVTRADLLAAVKEYHRVPRDVQLQPAHISALARKYARERYDASPLDSPERLALEARCDFLAGDEPRELEPAAVKQRQLDVSRYAARFGISGREAEARMAARNRAAEAEYRQALVAHQRAAAPPAPLLAEEVP